MSTDNITPTNSSSERERGKLTKLDIILCDEKNDAIVGQIKDRCGKAIPDALIILYQKCHSGHDLNPVMFEFSSKCGEFAFGPLCRDKEYSVKAWLNSPVEIRHECVSFCERAGCLKADCGEKRREVKFIDDIEQPLE